MRNKYKGQCYVCKKEVDVGKGYFERNGKGSWQVRHTFCKSLKKLINKK